MHKTFVFIKEDQNLSIATNLEKSLFSAPLFVHSGLIFEALGARGSIWLCFLCFDVFDEIQDTSSTSGELFSGLTENIITLTPSFTLILRN